MSIKSNTSVCVPRSTNDGWCAEHCVPSSTNTVNGSLLIFVVVVSISISVHFAADFVFVMALF